MPTPEFLCSGRKFLINTLKLSMCLPADLFQSFSTTLTIPLISTSQFIYKQLALMMNLSMKYPFLKQLWMTYSKNTPLLLCLFEAMQMPPSNTHLLLPFSHTRLIIILLEILPHPSMLSYKDLVTLASVKR